VHQGNRARHWVVRTLVLSSVLYCSLCGLAPSLKPAHAEPSRRVILDVEVRASKTLDPRATERLVALETADVDVPAPPDVAFSPPLYFRVLLLSPGQLRVELWELGQPTGARNVSSAGSDTLRSRRIGLAAAELARQLRSRRLSELARARRAEQDAGKEARVTAGFPVYGRVAWSAGARGAMLGAAKGWVVGPSTDFALHFGSGERVSLGAAWLQGQAQGPASLPDDPSLRWLEVRLSLARAFVVANGTSLVLGADAAAASVRLGGALGSPPDDTWSARAGGFFRVEQRLSPRVGLAVGPDVGVLLHPLTLSRNGETARLTGAWLGASATFWLEAP
jgi:hypothetical protein